MHILNVPYQIFIWYPLSRGHMLKKTNIAKLVMLIIYATWKHFLNTFWYYWNFLLFASTYDVFSKATVKMILIGMLSVKSIIDEMIWKSGFCYEHLYTHIKFQIFVSKHICLMDCCLLRKPIQDKWNYYCLSYSAKEENYL